MKKAFYLTTAIHYANADPHIGHAYEEVLSDVIARYRRFSGNEVWFLTGMDEHGGKILRASKEAKLSPQAFVNKYAKSFESLFKGLNISYDDFIRTSDKKKHWPGAEALWRAIAKNGDIYKKNYSGLYCSGCEEFKSERDLEKGFCPLHNTTPEKVEEENYFFRLSKYTDIVRKKIESGELKIVPEKRRNEILALLKNGLEDVSFSRPEKSIPWGIPVPDDPTQMMYVWCDALANYISAIGYGRDEKLFKKFWPADIHVVGKDILRFHAAIWPAMLISAGLPLPKSILVHGFITSEGKKMSKSIGNVVDPKKILDKYGAEAFRYFFSREIPPFEDGDFTEEKFVESYNANLANGLGNLVSRVLKMSESYFAGEVRGKNPDEVPFKETIGTPFGEEKLEGFSIPYIVREKILPKYKEMMDNCEIQRGSDIIWGFISNLDGYISAYEPFKMIKTDREKTEDVVWNLLYGIYYVSELIGPILPETSAEIKRLLGATLKKGEPVSFRTKPLLKPLFMRIG